MCNILVDKRDLNIPCGKMDVNGMSRVGVCFNGGFCECGDEDSGATEDRKILN
jgi:hypothetical protein